MSGDLERCVDFARRLIRTPSLPGEEGEIARLVRDEMEALGYDEVVVDDAGNVLGLFRGRGAAPALAFNTHLDHVGVGDPGAWPHPPFDAHLADGVLWGRGAVDIKGPLAAQVVGVAAALSAEPPRGDVWVTCVVQEEIGGVGARHLAERLDAPLYVIGEPSENGVRRGHRGRVELLLHLFGRSAHASVPGEGRNPLFALGRFLGGLDELEPATHAELGASTLVPTLLSTDQASANVIPGEVWLTLDARTVPGQDVEAFRVRLEELAGRASGEGVAVEVTIPVARRVTYTGLEMSIPADNPPYVLPAEHPAVRAAADLVADEIGPRPLDVWRFATDGGHFARHGAVPVGFGPGDPLLAHTVDERVEIRALDEALRVNGRLARELPGSA